MKQPYTYQPERGSITLGPGPDGDQCWYLEFATREGDHLRIQMPPEHLEEMADEFSGIDSNGDTDE